MEFKRLWEHSLKGALTLLLCFVGVVAGLGLLFGRGTAELYLQLVFVLPLPVLIPLGVVCCVIALLISVGSGVSFLLRHEPKDEQLSAPNEAERRSEEDERRRQAETEALLEAERQEKATELAEAKAAAETKALAEAEAKQAQAEEERLKEQAELQERQRREKSKARAEAEVKASLEERRRVAELEVQAKIEAEAKAEAEAEKQRTESLKDSSGDKDPNESASFPRVTEVIGRCMSCKEERKVTVNPRFHDLYFWLDHPLEEVWPTMAEADALVLIAYKAYHFGYAEGHNSYECHRCKDLRADLWKKQINEAAERDK